jgi:hypothetical protein
MPMPRMNTMAVARPRLTWKRFLTMSTTGVITTAKKAATTSSVSMWARRTMARSVR